MNIATILNFEFEKRKQKNERYSLRAFAKSLQMDPTALIRIMQEERIPNVATTMRILDALGTYPPVAIEEIKTKAIVKKKSKKLLSDSFDNNVFEAVYGSKHLYFMAAFRATDLDFADIKTKLMNSCNIDETEFHKIIQDLLSVGAIKETSLGFETVIKHKSTVPLVFSTEKRRNLQKEFLTKGIQSIDEIALEERENTTLTINLSAKDWPRVKRILKEARAKINKLSDNPTSTEAVYNICMAAYPVVKLS